MSTEPQRGDLLDIDDLVAVQNAIHSCRTKWYDLGLQLKVPVDTLKTFEIDYQSSSDRLREVITTWLKNGENPTWRAIVEALRSPVIREANLAKKIHQEYCSSAQPPAHDAPILGEKRVHEMIDEKMKDVHEMIDKRMKVEIIYHNSVENIKFLDIQKKLGKLEDISRSVTSFEVLVDEQCVKLVGTREECQKAKQDMDFILCERMSKSLPEFVSSAAGKHATRCMEKNDGVLVLPQEREILFIAEDGEHCKKAIEWMEENAYPFALQLKERERFFFTTSSLHMSSNTPVEVKAVPDVILAKYLHPSDLEPTVTLCTMELKQTAKTDTEM